MVKPVTWKDRLRPYADHFSDMYTAITITSDEDLKKLEAACQRVREDNCGWDVYAAGKHLMDEVRVERQRRRRAARANRRAQPQEAPK